ncbi:MAG: YfhO family protein [Phycisphaerae bacterium]|nr:YfhO family protein [Phycisphaerae bacterium]
MKRRTQRRRTVGRPSEKPEPDGGPPSDDDRQVGAGPPRRLTSISRADWICVGVLLAVTLGVFWQGFFDRVNMIHEDAAYVFQCYYEFAADEVRAGRFPHWNPFAMCGIPYHAGLQGAVLYPLRWPLFWLSYPTGYAMSLVAHFYLTGVLLYIFLRTTLRCSPVASLIGTLSFTFGGFTLGHLSQPSRFQAYPWFVLAVMLVAQAMERRSWAWAVAAAVPVALLTLTGDGNLPLILSFGLVLWAGSELIVRLVHWTRGSGISPGAVAWPGIVIVVALGLGAAIAAAQIIPAMALTRLSTRADAGWEFITAGSIQPWRIFVQLIAPFYWGNYRLGYWGQNFFHDPCFYGGIIPLILAVVAVATAPRDRWVLRLVGLCVITALIGAGKYLPFYGLLYDLVPMFDKLRGPNRLLVWFQLGLACLAALGAQRALAQDISAYRSRLMRGVAAVGFTVFAVTVGALFRLDSLAVNPATAVKDIEQLKDLRTWEREDRISAVKSMPRKVMWDHDWVTWAGIAAGLGSCVACSLLLGRRSKRPSFVGGTLAGLLIVDLGAFSAGMINYSDVYAAVVDVPPHVKYLQENLGTQRYLCFSGPSSPTAMHRGMQFRIRHAIAGGVGIYHTPRQEKMIGQILSHRRLWDLVGIRYVVADRVASERLHPAFRDGQYAILENKGAFPRAFLVSRVQTMENPDDVLQEIRAGEMDLSKIALLEQAAPPLPVEATRPSEPDHVEILRSEPGRYWMRTRASGGRRLVLTESYHPQWRCTVNGEPARILLTDYMFMSVPIPPGQCEIAWWYDPVYFRWGTAVTLAATGLVIAVLIGAWIQWRRLRALTNPGAPRNIRPREAGGPRGS